MEIAIGVVFLALFAGAFFLLVLITGFYFWRRSKRKKPVQSRQFSSAGNHFAENDSLDEGDHQSDFQDANPVYFNNPNNSDSYQNLPVNSESSDHSSKKETANYEAAASLSYESPSEGGGYASTDSDSSSTYESSSSYDSSSSYESSSSSSDSSSSNSSDSSSGSSSSD